MRTCMKTQGNETKWVSHNPDKSNRELLRSGRGQPPNLPVLGMAQWDPIGGSRPKNMLVVMASKLWSLEAVNPPFFDPSPLF